MEYIEHLAWLSLWPITLYLGYKVVMRNILKYESETK